MNGASEAVGNLKTALAHTEHLLKQQPALAAEQAAEILRAMPNQPVATLFLGMAQRLAGDPERAIQTLERLCTAVPTWAAAHYQLALAYGEHGRGDDAVAGLGRAVELEPGAGDAWRALGDHLTAIGDGAGADAAYAQQIRCATNNPRLLEAASALCDNKLAPSETILREYLVQYPTDVAAIRMLAEVAGRLGRYGDAEKLLTRCLELSPSFRAARHNYAIVLHRQQQHGAALTEISTLLVDEPRNPGYRNLKAAILAAIGDYAESIELYAAVLADYPRQFKGWMSYGHALKTAGRAEESIAAYRRATTLAPHFGEAYWSLANMKTFRFTTEEIATLRRQLARTELDAEDRFHFEFALGKALEDAREYEASFAHYERGNQLRRRLIQYDPDETSDHASRSIAMLTREFFASRAGYGSDAQDPIFIVGLPRSGSTLIEQILSSHSLVEGTMELPDIRRMARGLGERKLRTDRSRYPEVLASLSADECRALGERYLAETRVQRKTDAPYFIDKMPNNFEHLGLIHLILPNAKLIDARRHPLACCFSGFKQHFARGQEFTYGLTDIGRYYRDYVTLMAHVDRVLPGRVHRVIYESMVEDTEAETRRLLDYCGLDFEQECLRFYENERAVRTASSEQVRQPIFKDGVDHWRNYEPWLGPLETTLGAVLDAYPSVPQLEQLLTDMQLKKTTGMGSEAS
jgi:predicted Zn-dependent protease